MSDTELIKQKIDIATLIGEYVQLKPAGSNLKGLCPFHNEKTPSFMVSRERQRWHCFGCSKGGDIFSFIEEIEGMEFVEVLKLLADRAGVTLSRQIEQVSTNTKNRLKEINGKAAHFFHEFFIRMSAAEEARAYIRQRGLECDTVDAWQIGYAPEQWDLLTQYLLKKGYAIEELVKAGLTIRRDGANQRTGRGFYDRFRDRIMFPIRDVHGTVVGFTGRLLHEHEKAGGKYVNTPQTEIYDKSRVVFGLDRARQSIRQIDQIVMVEGQMDVIASHQAGMTNVIATSGTAMTEAQITLLTRYSKNIAMAFDADAAGEAAARRGIALALTAGMNISVITIPDGAGKDPDECLRHDPKVWFRAVSEAQDIMAWYIERACTGAANLSDLRAKQQITQSVLPEIARIPSAVIQDHWLRELAERLRIDVTVLREDMSRINKTNISKMARVTDDAESTLTSVSKSRVVQLAEHLLSILIAHSGLGKDDDISLSSDYFPQGAHRDLYEWVSFDYTDGTQLTEPPAEAGPLREILLMRAELEFSGFGESEYRAEARRTVALLRKEWTADRMKELERAIAEAERSGDQKRLTELLTQLQQLIH